MKTIITLTLALLLAIPALAEQAPTAPGETVGPEKCTATRASDNRDPRPMEEAPVERPANTTTVDA